MHHQFARIAKIRVFSLLDTSDTELLLRQELPRPNIRLERSGVLFPQAGSFSDSAALKRNAYYLGRFGHPE
jgi:hypothetical protein